MPTFADMTPEQRAAARAKAHESARRNREAKKALLTPDAPPEAEVAEPVKIAAPVDELDPFDGLLTDEEKTEIERAANKRAREDQRKKLKAAYAKEMLEKAQRELGSTPPDEAHKQWVEEQVRIYVDMPRLRKPTGGEHDPEPIIIDQTAYASGRYYDVPRGKAIYLLYLMDQAKRHVNQVDGRSRTYYNQTSGQMIYQGGAASGGGSFGTSFDALHKRPA
jgi:hypothetical protein